MLLEKIEALRTQPKAVRNRYAFVAAFSVTMVIAIVWGISLPARLQVDIPVAQNNDADRINFVDQFAEIRNYVGDSLGDIQAQAELISATTSVDTQSATSSALTPVGTTSIEQLSSTTKPLIQ